MTLTIRKLEENIGAEIRGVDVSSAIDEPTFERILEAFYEYSVIVFPDQEITDEQHAAFSRRFGRLESPLPSDPAGKGSVFVFSNLDENGDIIPPDDARMTYLRGNMLWHSDGSFRETPLKGSLLSAKAAPPEGGETEFASTRAAYAALPQAKKTKLEGLIAEHSLAHSREQIAPNLMTQAFLKETPPVNQMLVRSIRETSDKALFVGSYTTRIIGWPVEEGRALLKDLLEWSTQSRFVYRHKWRANDLVAYDNRTCLHRGRPWDAQNHIRILHRTTLAGNAPTTA
jgi:alpha-ketoglutarate-dependent 2,4-dichlorophenoxyacetate dioxygenase